MRQRTLRDCARRAIAVGTYAALQDSEVARAVGGGGASCWPRRIGGFYMRRKAVSWRRARGSGV